MLREYVVVTIGVLTLLAASAAVYEVLALNMQIQAKSDQTRMPDYSAQLDSLNSQIGSMKSELAVLSSLNSNVTDIHEKLTNLDNLKNNITNIQQQITDLESKTSQVQQIASVTPNLAFILDKSSYLPGNTIQITIIGASPQNAVEIELLDSGEFILVHKETSADTSGRVTYGLQLSSAMIPGNYVLKVTSGQQTSSQPVQVITSGTSQGTTTSSSTYTLTAQTDKTTYLTGQQIEVSGKTQPNTTVTGVMTSPSGKTYNSVTTSNADGTYFIFYSPMSHMRQDNGLLV